MFPTIAVFYTKNDRPSILPLRTLNSLLAIELQSSQLGASPVPGRNVTGKVGY